MEGDDEGIEQPEDIEEPDGFLEYILVHGGELLDDEDDIGMCSMPLYSNTIKLVLSSATNDLLDGLLSAYTRKLGRGSMRIFRARLIADFQFKESVHDPSEGALKDFLLIGFERVRDAFLGELSPSGLRGELKDQRLRDHALEPKEGAKAYMQFVHERVAFYMSCYPRRFWVPEIAVEDFQGEVLLRLLELIINGKINSYEHPAQETTFLVAQQLAKHLRVRRLLYEVPQAERVQSWKEAMTTDRLQTPLTILEALEAKEGERDPKELAIEGLSSLKERLTGIQRKWLQAFEDDIRKHGTISFTRVARSQKRRTSNAHRAFQRITERALPMVLRASREKYHRLGGVWGITQFMPESFFGWSWHSRRNGTRNKWQF